MFSRGHLQVALLASSGANNANVISLVLTAPPATVRRMTSCGCARLLPRSAPTKKNNAIDVKPASQPLLDPADVQIAVCFAKCDAELQFALSRPFLFKELRGLPLVGNCSSDTGPCLYRCSCSPWSTSGRSPAHNNCSQQSAVRPDHDITAVLPAANFLYPWRQQNRHLVPSSCRTCASFGTHPYHQP